MASTGEVILPVETPNNAHHNTVIEHMTQIEIKQSKYGPHRYSTSSDDVDTIIQSTAHHIKGNDVSDNNSSPSSRRLSTRVCMLFLVQKFITMVTG